MRLLASANLLLKFVIELAALAALGYWGSGVGSGATSVILAACAPLAAMFVWARFAAPRSTRRLRARARVPFEMTVFALAVGGLIARGADTLAIALAALVLFNALLLSALGQWDA
jgi:hypothetical protein